MKVISVDCLVIAMIVEAGFHGECGSVIGAEGLVASDNLPRPGW